MGNIIAFSNQKGGVGKTTTCVNLSAFLAKMGKRILLVDLDPQGNASSGLGIKKSELKQSVYTVLTEDCDVEQAILSSVQERLDVLPSSIDLAGAEVELVYMENREKVLSEALDTVKMKYDYVMIDCPPSLGLLTINALSAADSVIIPIQSEFYALEGLSQLMNTVKLVTQQLNSKLKVNGVVLTMYDPRTVMSGQISDQIAKFFGKKLYETRIPRNIRLSEAPSHGLPVLLYDRNCAGAKAYQALAEEFLARDSVTLHPSID